MNDFQGEIDAAAAGLYLNDANGLLLNDLDLTAYSTITAGTAITQTTATGAGNAVDASEVSLIASGGVIALGNEENNFGSVQTSATGAVTLGDIDGVILQSQQFIGSLTVNASGDVTDDNAFTLTLNGPVYLDAGAGSVTFDNDNLDFQGVVTASGASVSLEDDNNLTVGNITATTGAADLRATDTLTVNTGATVQGGTVSLSGNLVNSSGTITANTGGVDIDATLTVTSAGQINATTSMSLVDIDAGDNVVISAIDAAGVSINSTGGNITQSAGTITAREASDFAASGTVTLTGSANDFQNTVALAGTDVSLTDANGVDLADVNAATLTVNAGGPVTQANMTSLTVTTNTSVTTTDDILLANEANVIAGGVTLSGEDINLDAGGDITLGAINASNLAGDMTINGAGDVTLSGGSLTFSGALTGVNDLDVVATGPVSQTAPITVGGVFDVVAVDGMTGQTIDLSDMGNDFQGVVDAEGQNITLVDANSLTLGVIAAGGMLTAEAKGGDIRDVLATSDISAGGAASFTASNNIQIDRPSTHAFSSVTLDANQIVNFETDASGVRFDGITTRGANLQNTIEVSNGLTDLAGDVSLAPGADITFRLRGDLLQTAGQITADEFAIVAFGADTDVTLEGLNNDLNAFRSARQANIQVGDVSVRDIDDLALAGNRADNLTVQTGGAITQTDRALVNGSATFITTGDAVTLTETDNDFLSVYVDTTSGMSVAANVSITDVNEVSVGDISAASLTITAGGDVMQISTTTIIAIGTTTLSVTGGGATLSETTNDFASVTGVADSITLQDANAINLQALTSAAGDVSVSAAGDVTVVTNANISATDDVSLTSTVGGSTISIAGTTQITADSDADMDGDVTLQAVGGFLTANSANASISGANTMLNGGVVSSSATITATDGGVDIDAEGGATLNGAVTATTAGSTVTIDAGGDIVVTTIDADVISAETTSGSIVQTSGAITTAAGTTVSGFAATGSVTLNQTGNNFQGPVALSGQSVTIRDTDALLLDDVTATGTFTVTAGGAVTQNGTTTLTVGETTTVTATGQSVTLTNANDFQSTFVASGADVQVTDANALELGAITASTLTVIANGAVSQSAGAAVANDTTVTATGQTVDLDNAANAFTGVVNVAGGAVEIDNSIALGLGDVTATTLDAAAATGDVANSADDVLSVTGTTTITATTGAVNLASDAMNAKDLRQTVTLSAAGDISLTGVNSQKIVLGAVTSDAGTVTVDVENAIDLTGDVNAAMGGDAVTLRSAGDITQVSGGVMASELTVDSGGNSIAMSSATNDVDTLRLGANGAVTFAENDGLAIGQEMGGGQSTLTVRSTGAITQASTVTVTSRAVFTTEGGAITLDAEGNAFGSVSADTTANMSAANAVTITEGDATEVAGITGTSATITSGGAITQSGIIDASANSDFTAMGDITLDNAANDFADTGSGSTASFSGDTIIVTDVDTIALGTVVSTASSTITADDAGNSGSFSGGLTELRFFDTEGDMVLSSALVLPPSVAEFTADSVGAIEAQALSLSNANSLLDATTRVTFTTGRSNFASLTVNAPDGIDQTAPITVTGETDLNATNSQIGLQDATNDFQGRVDADASGITLYDANDLLLALIDSDTLVANAGGDITDLGAKIEGRNFASFTAGDDIIIDTLDTHVFNSAVELSADQITRFAASGSVDFGTITATNMTDVVNRLTVTNGVTFSGVVTTAGLSDLTLDTTNANVIQNASLLATDVLTLNIGTGNATLQGAMNDINTLSALAANSISLNDLDGVTIASVDATTLTVVAGDAIDQEVSSTIILDGAADLTADGADITLTEATNDFATIDAEGANLSFADVNGVELTDIDASGALKVDALNGAITDGDASVPGGDVDVTGTTMLTASGEVVLDDASNDFGQAVAADGTTVTLRDVNSIILGDIDTAGSLVVDAVAGSITDDGDGGPGADVNAGVTTLIAGVDITLDDAFNDFAGAVTASGGAITLNDINALELADIDAAMLTATAESIADGSPAMGANADIDVAGTSTLTARTGDITLDDATNDFGVVNTDGATVSLTDRNAIELGDIDANTLIVTATSIDDGAQGVAGEDVEVTGTSRLTASTTITLDDATNDFGQAVSADGQAITLRDANDIILGDVDAGGALVVDAVSGGISQDGDGGIGEDINATAAATFTASTTITLTDASNDFGSAVNADGTDVTLNDLNAIELADIDAGSLIVTATSIDDGAQGVAGEDVNVTGTSRLTASTTIMLDDATNDFGQAVSADGQAITLRDANDIILGDVDAGGALVVDAVSGGISQDGDGGIGEDINATAAATFTASTTITLTDASNDFGSAVNADGTDVTLNDLNAVELADIDAGSLIVTATSIDDGAQGVAGEDVNVTGTSRLTASTTIMLDDATNDFGQAVSADGQAITLRDANDIILGDVDAGGALVVDAVSGGISQDGDGGIGEDINAMAAATFTASTTITLTDASNDFGSAVNADGTDVTLNDLNAIELADIDAATLAVTAGSIDDGAASANADADINVAGTTSLTAAGDITADDATNTFDQAVSADGVNVSLRDADDIILGEVFASGSLTVVAAGPITDSANASVTVTGVTDLTAEDAGFAFDIALDNDAADDRHDFGGPVGAFGQDITLVDRNGIILGTVETNGGAPDDTINVDGGAEATDPGELIVIARGGAITQEAGSALTITGDARLEATDGVGTYFDITLTNTSNAFDSDGLDAVGDGDEVTDHVTFLGETVTISDTGPFFVFDSVANAGGVLIAQTGDLALEQVQVNASDGPLIGVVLDGAIDADDISGGSITLGGAGSVNGRAMSATGVVTVDDFSVDALMLASAVSSTLTNGDAGAALKVAAPLQTFTLVTVDAFTDGAATDFNLVTGSTAHQLILERMAFDGDLTLVAGDIDLGHVDADDGFFATTLTGDITKRADVDLDFASSGVAGFTVAGARGAADQSVMLRKAGGAAQTFDTLLRIGGAASFTATSGDVVITRGLNGGVFKAVDLQGPVSIAATDATIEDQNSLQLGQVAIDSDIAIRINSDNANAATETLTQTASQAIFVGGDLALITGVGAAERSDITLTNAGNLFNTVNALAGNLSIRGADEFTLSNTSLSGGLTIGAASAQHIGDLVLRDVQLDGSLSFDATGSVIVTRLDVSGATGVAGQAGDGLIVTDLRADGDVQLATSGGDLVITDANIGAFDFDSAGALTIGNLATAGSEAAQSTASGDITVANIISNANASFDSTGGALDIDSARIGSTLTLAANGDITLGAVEIGDAFTATSDDASIRIRDAATEAPADIVVDGVAAAQIGLSSGPIVSDIADGRVVEAFAGTAGKTNDPADFTLQLAIGGDANFAAAGSVLLPREVASEGAFQNDFAGDVAIAAATGDVVIEDANTISFGAVSITSGDLSVRSNADNTGAGEGITQVSAMNVGGAASFVTGDHGGAAITDEAFLADVTLTNAGNDFRDAVSIVADNAAVTDANALTVANVRLADSLTVAAGDATIRNVETGGDAFVRGANAVDLDRLVIGGALTATSDGAGLAANDLAVSGPATLSASTTWSIDHAILADATITAGASGVLTDVSARVINVETGGVTISGLSAGTTTILSSAAADIEQLSSGVTVITVADETLALSQATIAGSLIARAGAGAIALADLSVDGDAVIDGGPIRSDASGGGETRVIVTGTLDLDGSDVALTDLSVLGSTTLDATGEVTLDDVMFGDLSVNASGNVAIKDAGAAVTKLATGGALDVTNTRISALDADATGTAKFEAIEIVGDADILSTGGDVRFGSVDVEGALTARANNGAVGTFDGTKILAEVTISAAVATALPAFVAEGPVANEIGVEAALANSPADEARVQETLNVVADRPIGMNTADQALDVVLAASTNDRLLEVAGPTSLTAATDLTLDDADIADATLSAGGSGTLTTVTAEMLSVTTGGALAASVLNAGDTTIQAGGAVDLSDVAAAATSIAVTDQALAARRVGTNGPLNITTGAGDVALADINVAGDAAFSGANIASDPSGAGETRVSISGALDLDATGDVSLTDLSVVGATDVDAGGAVALDDLSLADVVIAAGGDLALTDGQMAAAKLSTGGALDGSNLRIGSLAAAAQENIDLDVLRVTNDAALLSASSDINLGSVSVGRTLIAESAAGAIRTINSDFALGAVTISGATPASVPSFGANTTPAVGAALLGAEANETLVSVGGDAYFLAAGDILLVDDEIGVTGDNDFKGGVTAIAGGSVMLNDANDLILGAPTGVATPAGDTVTQTGVVTPGSLRVEVGRSVFDADAPQSMLAVGGDALFLARRDVLLDNETHVIDGVIGAAGRNITLTERGVIALGPIAARGDLVVEAGANNTAAGGTTGAASIRQIGTVTVANAAVGAGAASETSTGPIDVVGASTFSTGLNPLTDLDGSSLTGDRDLVLDDPANDFGGRLNVARISGDATIVENSLPGAISGVQEIGNFEIGGTTRLTTTDNVVFAGRMTAIADSDEPDPTARPETVLARSQGDLGLADADLRLFITSGESLIIDTTGGGVAATGADVRFDRPVDGDNTAAPVGTPDIVNIRSGLGALTITGGTEGEVRFRDFVGAQNPLGDVDLNAGDIFAGFTFAELTPDLAFPGGTADNRFLFDRTAQNDFFFADDVRVNGPGRIEFLTPPGTVDFFILNDLYFGVNVTTFTFGDLGAPETIQAFGFIGRDRARTVGLLPVGPRGPTFQFNDCVIGDVADCTTIPIPNVINNVLIAAPPLLGIDTEDLLELFGSFGNEELWGVPQSYYSDLGVDEENRPSCPEGSADPACRGE